jgi:hypothetical protein
MVPKIQYVEIRTDHSSNDTARVFLLGAKEVVVAAEESLHKNRFRRTRR